MLESRPRSDAEVQALHNVEGDESPAPGETERTPIADKQFRHMTPEEQHRMYDERPGEDPGHRQFGIAAGHITH